MRLRAKSIFTTAALLLATGVLVSGWTNSADRVNLAHMLEAPTREHWLGTDNLGRDLATRLGKALLVSTLPLWLLAFVSWFAGLGIGLLGEVALAGSAHKIVHKFLLSALRCLAYIRSVPVAALVLLAATYAEKLSTLTLFIPLFVVIMLESMWLVHELHVRDAQKAFWTAHVALGGQTMTRLVRYGVCGEWRSALALSLAHQLQLALVIEAALSYLGIGIVEPQPSFGNILASHFDRALHGSWGVIGITALLYYAVLALPVAALGIKKAPRA